MCTFICVHLYVYIYMCTFICVHLYVYIYMCTFICVHLYAYVRIYRITGFFEGVLVSNFSKYMTSTNIKLFKPPLVLLQKLCMHKYENVALIY